MSDTYTMTSLGWTRQAHVCARSTAPRTDGMRANKQTRSWVCLSSEYAWPLGWSRPNHYEIRTIETCRFAPSGVTRLTLARTLGIERAGVTMATNK